MEGGGIFLVRVFVGVRAKASARARAPVTILTAKPDTNSPTPYTLHPTPYTLHPTPCTLHALLPVKILDGVNITHTKGVVPLTASHRATKFVSQPTSRVRMEGRHEKEEEEEIQEQEKEKNREDEEEVQKEDDDEEEQQQQQGKGKTTTMKERIQQRGERDESMPAGKRCQSMKKLSLSVQAAVPLHFDHSLQVRTARAAGGYPCCICKCRAGGLA